MLWDLGFWSLGFYLGFRFFGLGVGYWVFGLDVADGVWLDIAGIEKL